MKTVFYLMDKHVYPALRRRLVEHLRLYGLTISEISRRTGLSKSLVSRYLRGERGIGLNVSRLHEIDQYISMLAEMILEKKLSPLDVEAYIGRLAVYMMWKKYVCGYHKAIDPSVDPADCHLCPQIFKGIEPPFST